MRYARLMMVDPDRNNNKYYEMTEDSDGTFVAKYGREGAAGQERAYPINQWDKKFQEKIQKGYTDVTQLYQVSESSEFAEIQNKHVARLVDILTSRAKAYVKRNYEFSSCTPEMIAKGRKLLQNLNLTARVNDLDAFNRCLLQIFTTFPRRMHNVSDYTAKSTKNFAEIMQRESSLMDAMEGQMASNSAADMYREKNNGTILDANGLVIESCNAEERGLIKKLMGADAHRIISMFRVENTKSTTEHENWCKANGIKQENRHLYFHGSITENYWNILCLGLKPSLGRGMFGYGTYFANKAKKSIGYTSMSGSYWRHGSDQRAYLTICEVAYKKPMEIFKHESRHTTLSNSDMIRQGTDAVFAHKGYDLVNDEIIVYQKEQIALKYIIEIGN